MVSPTTNVPTDEFASDEYGPEYKFRPFVQLIHDEDINRAGFFISAENANKVNFQATEEWVPFEKRFKSNNGETTPGFRSATARFAVLRRSPLFMIDRSKKKFLGVYDEEKYNRKIHILKTKYLVYLVGKQKQLLHDQPLQLTGKGSFGSSFGEEYEQFLREMVNAYGAKRGNRFFALCTFAVKLESAIKGEVEQAWVSSVSEHGIPKADNWQSFFLGYQPKVKEKLLLEFDANADFGKLKSEQDHNDFYDAPIESFEKDPDF